MLNNVIYFESEKREEMQCTKHSVTPVRTSGAQMDERRRVFPGYGVSRGFRPQARLSYLHFSNNRIALSQNLLEALGPEDAFLSMSVVCFEAERTC